MDEYEYMWLLQWLSPQYFIDENHNENIFINNIILVKICKGMYGIPQAGQFAYIDLIKHLKLHGCTNAGFGSGLFKDKIRDTMFILVVDDFGVKYTTINDALHLIDTMNKKYPGITIDWTGRMFIGINLYWYYIRRTVPVLIPDYVNKSL